MEKSFAKITLCTDNNDCIIIQPKKFYIIEDSNVRYVIIYNLLYIDHDKSVQPIESEIPYYISNGETNMLRANLLYPFLCYSTLRDRNICPFDYTRLNNPKDDGSIGILLKYHIGNNIDIDALETELLSRLVDLPDESERDITRHDWIERNVSNSKSNNPSGITSHLSRIDNLIDFIIFIMSETIINFNYVNENEDILKHGKYTPLSKNYRETIDIKNYIDMSILAHFEIEPSFIRQYRLVLLTILNKYSRLIIDNSLINLEFIQLSSESINEEKFNNIINYCDINKTRINTTNYMIISNKIINLINNKIDETKMNEIDKQNIKSIIKNKKIEKFRIGKNGNAVCTKDLFFPKVQTVSSMNIAKKCDELNSYNINDPEINEKINTLCNHTDDQWAAMNNNQELEKILREVRQKIYKEKFDVSTIQLPE